MKNSISRRDFLMKSGILGTFFLVPTSFMTGSLFGKTDREVIELAQISGSEIYQNTLKAINELGSIKRFVKQGQRVGILVSSDSEKKGTFVNPDIAHAVIKACSEQSATEIICIKHIKPNYWQQRFLNESNEAIIENLNNSSATIFPAKFDDQYFENEKINEEGLKRDEIVKTFFDCDVLINIFIAKHHATSIYTGAQKNTMSVCTRQTNVNFHINDHSRNNSEYRAQCIVDLNAQRKPDLCIVNATEVLVTKVANNPDEVIAPGEIIAGTGIVATDSHSTIVIGHNIS